MSGNRIERGLTQARLGESPLAQQTNWDGAAKGAVFTPIATKVKSSRRDPKEAAVQAQAEREAHAHQQYAETVSNNLYVMRAGFVAQLEVLSQIIGEWNQHQGFWQSDNTGEKIALMHSELSEALEADRKNLGSDKIPDFTGIEEELADCLIRIFDFAGHHQIRLGEALFAKLQYNLSRPYKHEKKY